MTRQERHTRALEKLAKALSRRGMSAREIAARFKCSKPTVFARLDAIEDRGIARICATVQPRKSAAGKRGPLALVYGAIGVRE